MDFKSAFKGLLSNLPISQKEMSVVGLDIGSSSIKVVQIRKEKGKAVLETYGEIATGPYISQEVGKAVVLNEDQTASAIKDLFKEANITSMDGSMAVPFTFALSKVIKVPKMSKDKLKTVIPIEARKYVPMPLNEVMLDWFVLPKAIYEENVNANETQGDEVLEYLDVLLVAVHKDAIGKLQGIKQLLAMNIAFYELEAFAATRSSVEYDTVPQMLIDLGASGTKVYIVDSGIVRFSHLVNYGSQNITENLSRAMGWNFEKAERIKKERGLIYTPQVSKEENLISQKIKEAVEVGVNRIFSDINRVLLNFEKKYNRSITKIILSGGGANLPGIVEYVENKLSIPAQKALPFDKVQSPAFLEPVLKEIGPDFTVSIGLALRHINLR